MLEQNSRVQEIVYITAKHRNVYWWLESMEKEVDE